MSTYSDIVLADGPLLYWRFGEMAGPTAVDASPNGNDGTYAGTPAFNQLGLITGDLDTAVGFNVGEVGVGTDYCQSGILSWSTLTAFTVEAWVRPSDVAVSQHIAVGPHPIFAPGHDLAIVVSPTARFQFQYVDTSTGAHYLTGTTDLFADQAYHVAFTVENGGSAKLYVDCVQEDERILDGDYDNRGDGRWTFAATDDTSVDLRYRGIGDEFALYDYALTQDQLSLHCNPPIVVVPTDCYLIESDEVLFIDATEGDKNVLLLPSDSLPIPGHIYYIKRIDNSSNTVTIDPNGTVIDDLSSLMLEPYDTIAIVTDGQKWWRL